MRHSCSHLLSMDDDLAGSSFTALRARSLIRAPPSIRTAAHASCPSRIASSSGSTLLHDGRKIVRKNSGCVERSWVLIQWGAPDSSGMYHPNITAFHRAPTLRGIGKIQSSSHAKNFKQFHPHYREQWHYSTGTIGGTPLYTGGVSG